MKTISFIISLLLTQVLAAQPPVTKDIKWFGAKGDGKTNDHDAFIKAAGFFNKRAGNGKLLISKGVYVVGKQQYTKGDRKRRVYEGSNLLSFTDCSNFILEGAPGAIIKFKDSMHYGAFEPATGKAFKSTANFVEYPYAAIVGTMVMFNNCSKIKITNLNLNGNANGLIVGGAFGDMGIQLPNLGIHLNGSKDVMVTGCTVSHFGLDGIMVGNDESRKAIADKVNIANSVFEYNCRQGLSWVGGTNLTVTNSKFNHTGRGKFTSAPSAGVDIEAETGPVSGGSFINCEFINNAGCGMAADTGPSSNCTFTRCLFWGTTAWSVWVNKPGFTFTESKFYGSIVHGFSADKEQDATKFYSCWFEDKPYNGKEPYGNFLIEINYVKRMRFENCTMLAHKKKVAWMESVPAWKPDEKYQLINCRLQYDGNNLPKDDWVALLKNVQFKNCSFELTHPDARQRNYWFYGFAETYNINLGGNKLKSGAEIKPL